MASATAVEISQNVKTGFVSATYASQKSCDSDCPFLGKGCYAEHGYANVTTQRLNKDADDDLIAIAQEEAALIDGLSGKFDLRVHVVGDCKTDDTATIVASAMKRHRRKKGRKAWTYTHAWRKVAKASWLGESVLASCETPNEVLQAKEKGYAAAIVVEKFEREKLYEKDGIRLLPCPNQTSRKLTCADCGICMNASALERTGITVAFEAHGTSKKKIITTIENKKRMELAMV